MKMHRAIIYVTAVGSPVRAESDLFWLFLTNVGQFKALLASWIHIVVWKHLLEHNKPFQVSIIENRVVENWCNSCTGPYQSRKCFLGYFDVFLSIQEPFVVGKPLCDLEPPLSLHSLT